MLDVHSLRAADCGTYLYYPDVKIRERLSVCQREKSNFYTDI
jgi:hypothetical protein